jgi:uncharacterized protein (TIGR00369 family)
MDPTSASSPPRAHTLTWEDPRTLLSAVRTLSGLECLRRVIAGELPAPPMAQLMNIRLVEAAPGHAVFEGVPEEYHYNPLGTVHGGMAATLLDSAMGCCVHTCLEAGDRYTTLEIKVSYLKAITLETGPVRAISTLIHIGRTTALAEARVVDKDDIVHAHGTSTCLIKRA